jgi:branched-chain amino acid transport system substrate-binding protein
MRVRVVIGLLCCTLAGAVLGERSPTPVYVGLDGEFGLLNSTSAQAIEQGIRVAFEQINEAGGVLGGRPLQLLIRDNRSVPARGVENIRRFAEIDDLVAVVGGRFSPVILESLPLIHEQGLVLLDAWGSADGITDHNYRPSYTFRLSLRDRYAMPVMLRHAQAKGLGVVGLLLPNTGWGRSNEKAARRYGAMHEHPVILEPVWYNWGDKDMLSHYWRLLKMGAEAIVLVANDIEGALLVRQLEDVSENQIKPIISHWGVTGGRMHEQSGAMLAKIDFSVVQTFSLFNADPQVRGRVMATANKLFGMSRIEQVASPVGFGQAYDLMHILARALELAGSTQRAAVRDALEQVHDYAGLTGFYARPFSPESHDALGEEQVFMARYRDDGVIVPIVSGDSPAE